MKTKKRRFPEKLPGEVSVLTAPSFVNSSQSGATSAVRLPKPAVLTGDLFPSAEVGYVVSVGNSCEKEKNALCHRQLTVEERRVFLCVIAECITNLIYSTNIDTERHITTCRYDSVVRSSFALREDGVITKLGEFQSSASVLILWLLNDVFPTH
jgi:hypothetical protein